MCVCSEHCKTNLNTEIGVGVTHILQESIVLLAHERLAVMAGHIMPVHTIIVEVVQHGKTVLVGTALLELTVVWLRFANATVSGPVGLAAIGCWSEFLKFSSPEPAVHRDRLQIWAIASLEITYASTCPDVLDLKEKRIA